MERREAACYDLEPMIAAQVAGELSREEESAVRRHLDQCPPCRRLAAEQQGVRALLRVRARGLQEDGPPLLEERIRQGLERADAERGRRGRWVLGTLAAAVAGVWLGTWALNSRGSTAGQEIVAEAVNDHIRSLLSPDTALQVATSDPQALSAWFRGRLDIAVDVPSLTAAGLQLRGGRVCYLLDRPVAYLLYEGDRTTPHSLFMIGRSGVHLPRADEVTLEGRRVCLTRYKGYALAVWEAGGIVYALVGDCPRAELESIARIALRG